jgi:Tfp pilus assembly protein PilN
MTTFNINLIAARRRQKQRAAAYSRVAFYSLIAIVVVAVLVYLQAVVATQQVKSHIDTIQAELSSPGVADKVARIQFLEQQTAQLTPRVELLEQVHTSEAEWIRILYDVSGCIPPNVWLGQMSSARSHNDQALSLRGRALNQRDIGNFMLALNEPGWSQAAALGFSQASGSTRSTVKTFDFEITVPLTGVIGSDLK